MYLVIRKEVISSGWRICKTEKHVLLQQTSKRPKTVDHLSRSPSSSSSSSSSPSLSSSKLKRAICFGGDCKCPFCFKRFRCRFSWKSDLKTHLLKTHSDQFLEDEEKLFRALTSRAMAMSDGRVRERSIKTDKERQRGTKTRRKTDTNIDRRGKRQNQTKKEKDKDRETNGRKKQTPRNTERRANTKIDSCTHTPTIIHTFEAPVFKVRVFTAFLFSFPFNWQIRIIPKSNLRYHLLKPRPSWASNVNNKVARGHLQATVVNKTRRHWIMHLAGQLPKRAFVSKPYHFKAWVWSARWSY